MMNSIEVVKKISSHYLVTHDMPLQIQLGFPYLEKKDGCLYISFKAHKEIYCENRIDYYKPQYDLKFAFPFDHVVAFNKIEGVPMPVASVSAEFMLSEGQDYIKDLYDACSIILTLWEESGKVSDSDIFQYQQQYKKTLEAMGLQDVF